MEVLQSPTEMTAMDLFSVNLTLFPTVLAIYFYLYLFLNFIFSLISWWVQR
jgi:hypothetical protein